MSIILPEKDAPKAFSLFYRWEFQRRHPYYVRFWKQANYFGAEPPPRWSERVHRLGRRRIRLRCTPCHSCPRTTLP